MTDNELVTGKVQLHFLAVWEPKLPKKKTDPKDARYSACLLIDKTDHATLGAIKKITEALKDAVKLSNGGRLPNGFKMPLHDGDVEREGDEVFAGKIFMNCSSKRQPGMFYADGKPIVIPSELFSGCFGQAHVNFFTYNNESQGISAGLNNILLLNNKVEALGGVATSAAQAFGFQPGVVATEPDEEDYLN